ncbi:MAG TPA: hypothetical protein VJ747_09510 [Stellaceae bacterium]|nr:hypothetical protein [Stellaceae bacterium]
MTATTIDVPAGGFRYIPGVFQYSGGVAALDGFRIERVEFRQPIALQQGFAFIERYLGTEAVSLQSFCACELRSPAPFSEAGFTAFNRHYVGTLERWGVMQGDANPVARSNVCPEQMKPAEPSFHAFSYARQAPGQSGDFVISGSGEAEEGHRSYRERTIRFGDTSAEGLREKARFVLGRMESRMAVFHKTWRDATAVQLYTVFDPHPVMADEIVRRGAAAHGLTWHFARPPVEGLDYEMDCRAVALERRVSAAV